MILSVASAKWERRAPGTGWWAKWRMTVGISTATLASIAAALEAGRAEPSGGLKKNH
jgi:hypothetical protein